MKDFTNVLIAVLIIASVPYPGDAAVPECPADGTEVCFDCTTKGDCASPGAPAVAGIKCAAGEACEVVGGVATCMPVAKVAGCSCGGRLQGCDAYNTDKQIFCIPVGGKTNIFPGTDCASPTKCSEGQCVTEVLTPNPCEGKTITGFYPAAPKCTSGAFCVNEEEVFTDTCKSGEYFNKAAAKCEAFPPNPCTGCRKQKCPIISDCSKYAICSNGQVLDDDESCPDGKFFNSETEACEDAVAGVCTVYEACEFESTASAGRSSRDDTTTTTKPDQCTEDNVNQRYPHETDCRKYYVCMVFVFDVFEYVLLTCPESQVFNATSRMCEPAGDESC